jgi:hypothetical protein
MEQSSQPFGLRLSEGLGVLRGWWRAWQHRREWTTERQLEHLRQMVQGDHRWLAHDKTADAMTTRYLAALGPDWMRVVHTDPCHFRREIGLEPAYNQWRNFGSPEHLARIDRIARGEMKYSDGPLPETGWD